MSHNFAEMDFKSLRTYVIEHQDNDEAFYTFVDRLQANSSSPVYPPPNTPENIAIMEQAIKDKVAALKQKHESNSEITMKGKREFQKIPKEQLASQTLEIKLSLEDVNKITNLAEQSQIPAAPLAQKIIHRYLGGELVEKQS